MAKFNFKEAIINHQNVCRCEAYSFPHRLDSGECRKLYNKQAKEEAEWNAYLAQRGVNAVAMHQSGHSEKDFA